MAMKILSIGIVLALFTAVAQAADDPGDSQRYGAFGLLDHRSTYGTYWFPEPLNGPEMDVDRELRIDYFHGESQNAQETEVKAELEWNFGLLTLELELPYSRESESAFDPDTGRIL